MKDWLTRLCKNTPCPPKQSHLLALGEVALAATAWGGGQFNRGKGHRSQAVISGCGLNVSDSCLSAARGLCSFGGAYRSSTSLGLDVNKNFSKTGNAAAGGWRETTSCQNATFQCVLINNPEGKRMFTSASLSPQCIRSECLNKSLFSRALKCVFFILVFLCSDSAVRWGQNKYLQISAISVQRDFGRKTLQVALFSCSLTSEKSHQCPPPSWTRVLYCARRA